MFARHCWAILASLVFVAFGTDVTRAKTVTLSTTGYWDAFGGTAVDGVPVCGIGSTTNDGRAFTLKWFKSTWAIPKGMPIDVDMRIDGAPAWAVKAKGITAGDLAGVELYVASEDISKFSNEIRFGNQIIVWFPTGTETPWALGLLGSNGAISTMTACIKYLNDQGGSGSTQPYTGNSQPYGMPSQPYVPSPPVPAPVPQPSPAPTNSPASPYHEI